RTMPRCRISMSSCRSSGGVFTYDAVIQAHNLFFLVDDTAPTDTPTLSLHDALPIWRFPAVQRPVCSTAHRVAHALWSDRRGVVRDRKSTRLNSSHVAISYAVFCL